MRGYRGFVMGVLLFLGGCSSAADRPQPVKDEAQAQQILDGIAADLGRLLAQARSEFERDNPGGPPRLAKADGVTELTIACPGGGTLVVAVTANLGAGYDFEGTATLAGCVLGSYTVGGTLAIQARVIPGGVEITAQGTLAVTFAGTTVSLEIASLTLTVVGTSVCYEARVRVAGLPVTLRGGAAGCGGPTADGGGVRPDGGAVRADGRPLPDLAVHDAGALPACSGSPVEWSDGDFAEADWTAEIIPGGSPVAPTFSATQKQSGGNPGKYRSIDMDNGGGGTVNVLHLRQGASYDPQARGAIDRIYLRLDAAAPGSAYSSLMTLFSMAVVQDGKLFWAGRQEVRFRDGWLPKTDWTEQDFRPYAKVEITERPDFSASGKPLQFGFISAVTGKRSDTGADNWIVRVCPPPGG